MTQAMTIQGFGLWDKLRNRGAPLAFDFEITARCNNDCRHCYINLPAGDDAARKAELTTGEILELGRQATGLGTVWCLLTGGEPLLRDDFEDVFLGLKRLGLVVSVFTNACLITPETAELFREHPPRDVEVSVYGATRETYERVTRRPGSYDAFVRGLDALAESGVPVRLKAMAIKSTSAEMDEIAAFCRERTRDYYRFDPLLHLRFDGDEARNEEIRAERLSPEEVVAVERADVERFAALTKGCEAGVLMRDGAGDEVTGRLFRCGVGTGTFTIGHDGTFRLCSSLCHPGTVVDVRPGAFGALSLGDAWERFVPQVRDLRSTDSEFLRTCGACGLHNLCLWCPAHAALETGELDSWVGYFCQVAHARAKGLGHVEGLAWTEE